MNPNTDPNFNDDDAIIDSEEGSSTNDSAPQVVEGGEPSVQESAAKKSRRPRGKIGRMCKVDRDRVNFMLRDGVPYPEIIARLGEVGKGLVPRNVGNWHNGPGYQRWEKDQEWLEELRADQEPGLDLIPDFDADRFNEAALQVAVTQLFRAFRHLGSGDLKKQLGDDPQSFARLVNALARACRESVKSEGARHRNLPTING